MELSDIELELIAVSTSVAAGCIPCTEYHIAECRIFNVCADQISAAVRLGARVADASLMQIWAKFDEGVDDCASREATEEGDRQRILCSIGATVARNNVSMLGQLIQQARNLGINDREIMEVAGLARRIKAKAASHLEKPLRKLQADQAIADRAASLCE